MTHMAKIVGTLSNAGASATVALFLTAGPAKGDCDRMMTREDAMRDFGDLIVSTEAVLVADGIDLSRYNRFVTDRGEEIVLFLEYVDKPKGLRGSVPGNPDYDVLVRKSDGEILRKTMSR